MTEVDEQIRDVLHEARGSADEHQRVAFRHRADVQTTGNPRQKNKRRGTKRVTAGIYLGWECAMNGLGKIKTAFLVAALGLPLMAQGASAARAAALAPGLLYQQLSAQSGMLGYRDDFRMMAAVCFASLGLLFFLKKSERRAGGVPVH